MRILFELLSGMAGLIVLVALMSGTVLLSLFEDPAYMVYGLILLIAWFFGFVIRKAKNAS